MSHSTEAYYRQSWMTDDQWECARLIGDAMSGFHNVIGQFKASGHGIQILVPTHRMATFDFNDLTTLVLLAHDRCIRVEIQACSPHRVRLRLHRRDRRSGPNYSRHPTIEEAVQKHRQIWGMPETQHALEQRQ